MSIESRRKAQGMTRRALADAIGTYEKVVIRWEASKTSPDEKFLRRMSMVFGCPVDELRFETLGEQKR